MAWINYAMKAWILKALTTTKRSPSMLGKYVKLRFLEQTDNPKISTCELFLRMMFVWIKTSPIFINL